MCFKISPANGEEGRGDFSDSLKSTTSISGFSEENLADLYKYFENIRIKDKSINIPRETGLFISIK